MLFYYKSKTLCFMAVFVRIQPICKTKSLQILRILRPCPGAARVLDTRGHCVLAWGLFLPLGCLCREYWWLHLGLSLAQPRNGTLASSAGGLPGAPGCHLFLYSFAVSLSQSFLHLFSHIHCVHTGEMVDKRDKPLL